MTEVVVTREKTAAGTEYAWVDAHDGGSILLVGDTGYNVQGSYNYGGLDVEVAGWCMGGEQGGACEVYEYDCNDNVTVLKQGTEDECWHWMIDKLGGNG